MSIKGMKRKAVLLLLLIFVSLVPLPAQPATTKLSENQKILHLLNRIAFGARPGDVERVRKLGVDKFVDQQLHPERIDDSSTEAALSQFPSLKMDVTEINEKYVAPMDLARRLGLINPRNAQANPNAPQNNPRLRRELQSMMQERGLNPPQRLLQELQSQKLVRAVSSERQLQEVMTDFWFNHFNVFWGKGANRQLTTGYEMNAIRPHALGKFKDLVMATAKSPAMLFYLDNFQSSAPDSRMLQRLANRPQARKPGINENYARELMELHTIGVEGGYTQKDVQEVARAFTGWTIDRPRQDAGFVFRPMMHDRGEKTVLGHKISEGGIKDGEAVIDILVRHPSTARFIATKLVRRFVSDEPPKTLVDRVAAVYTRTDGDIREMLHAIFTSNEFYAVDAYRAKTKSPFELVVSSIRALGATTTGGPRLAQEIARMGQPLYQYQAPTGFPDRASQWTSAGALVERLNFGIALAANKVPATSIDLARFSKGVTSHDRAIDVAVDALLGGDVSDATKRILVDQIRTTNEPPLVKAFAMVLGSPEFQKR